MILILIEFGGEWWSYREEVECTWKEVQGQLIQTWQFWDHFLEEMSFNHNVNDS